MQLGDAAVYALHADEANPLDCWIKSLSGGILHAADVRDVVEQRPVGAVERHDMGILVRRRWQVNVVLLPHSWLTQDQKVWEAPLNLTRLTISPCDVRGSQCLTR